VGFILLLVLRGGVFKGGVLAGVVGCRVYRCFSAQRRCVVLIGGVLEVVFPRASFPVPAPQAPPPPVALRATNFCSLDQPADSFQLSLCLVPLRSVRAFSRPPRRP